MMEEFDDQKSVQGIDDYWEDRGPPQVVDPGPPVLRLADRVCFRLDHSGEYTSESLVLVEPPKVPSNLVAPNVQVDLADRVQSMRAQVLSRTRLLGSFNVSSLYPSDANSQDDQVKNMRDDIKMDLVQTPTNTGEAGTGCLQDFLRRQRSRHRAEGRLSR